MADFVRLLLATAVIYCIIGITDKGVPFDPGVAAKNATIFKVIITPPELGLG
jgi:hypothetical protein